MQPTFQYYLQDGNGNYFTAVLDGSSPESYTISSSSTRTPLASLPKGWDTLTLQWTRNNMWMGVFRTQTSSFGFVKDGRAILKALLFNGIVNGSPYDAFNVTGIQAYCVLEIDMISQVDLTYSTVYTSNINFQQASDNQQELIFTVPTLDSNLREKLDAYASTQYNVPLWIFKSGEWFLNDLDYGSSTPVSPVVVNNRGIKLLYNQRFTTGATSTVPLWFPVADDSSGCHNEFSLQQLNLIQANGSSTIVGNHLLENQFILGTQSFRSLPNNHDFEPFVRNSYCFWNLLGVDTSLVFSPQFIFDIEYNNPPAALATYPLGSPFVANFQVYGVMHDGDPAFTDNIGTILIWNDPSQPDGTLILLSEADYNPSGKLLTFENQNKTDIPNSIINFYDDMGNPIVTYTPHNYPVTLHQNGMTVIGMNCDTACGGPSTAGTINIYANDLDFYAFDIPAYSGNAVPSSDAPRLPDSTAIGFRPLDLLKALTMSMFTTQTDPNGMPDLSSVIDYNGEYGASKFLNDDTLDPTLNFDSIPFRTLFTCGNSLRNIQGIEYLSTSLQTFFNTLSHIYSVGLGIETISGVDVLKIETLHYFFDNTTLLLDLGEAVFGLTIKPTTTFIGNNIKTGFQQRAPNQDYGQDSFCVEQDYQTAITRVKADIDQTIADNCDMYQIELARAEQNSKDQSSANSDNQTYLIQINDTVEGTTTIYAPDLTPTVENYYNNFMPIDITGTVQNTDNTAATDPYVFGLLFPDTAVNLGLSPARCVNRNGAFFRSILDGMDETYLTFRKQYQLLFNQGSLSGGSYVPNLYPSVTSNLQVGLGSAPINEAADIQVGYLSSYWGADSGGITKLFRPYLMTISTRQPLNMYSIMASAPYGYIQFTVNGNIYQGFIWDVSQKLGNDASTTFTLLAHPDQTF